MEIIINSSFDCYSTKMSWILRRGSPTSFYHKDYLICNTSQRFGSPPKQPSRSHCNNKKWFHTLSDSSNYISSFFSLSGKVFLFSKVRGNWTSNDCRIKCIWYIFSVGMFRLAGLWDISSFWNTRQFIDWFTNFSFCFTLF